MEPPGIPHYTLVLENGNNNLNLITAVQERSLVLVSIHQPEMRKMLHTKLMIARKKANGI